MFTFFRDYRYMVVVSLENLKLFDFMHLFSGSSLFSKVRPNGGGGGGVHPNWRVYLI